MEWSYAVTTSFVIPDWCVALTKDAKSVITPMLEIEKKENKK